MVLGVGGIGSHLSFLLARQDCKLHLIDFDSVDLVNVGGGQLYGICDISKPKVEAIKEKIELLCDLPNITTYDEKYTENSFTCPIVFSCFDNMEARKVAFNKWKAQENRELFIDGRLGLSYGTVFTVIKGREEQYEDTLFNDSEVADAECTMKSTTHSATLIASLICASFANYQGIQKEFPCELPFRIDFDLFSMEVKYGQ
jgi:molybdopterin/thiamine biosynthesis adenylyltransferase